MKLRKTLAVLLGAAILTSAAVPMASAESADFSILPPNYESLIIADSENVTADVTENGPMTLTLSGSNSHSLVLMMWNNGTVENPFFNLAELPYLNWDISGNANWSVTVRYNDGSSPNTMVQMYTIDDSTPEGFAPGKGSLNFRDLIINNDKYEYLGDDMEMIAVVFDIFGDPRWSRNLPIRCISAAPRLKRAATTPSPPPTIPPLRTTPMPPPVRMTARQRLPPPEPPLLLPPKRPTPPQERLLRLWWLRWC